MNKKAALIHWIVFGIIAALGLFFVLTIQVDAGYEIKGEWQIGFLKENYLQAQQEDLSLQFESKTLILSLLDQLSKKGGFVDVPKCGRFTTFNFWNKADQFCFLQIKTTITGILEQELTNYANFNFNKQIFSAQSQVQHIVSSKYGDYIYYPHLNFDLGYSLLDEYSQLQEESLLLLNQCRNAVDLITCLNSNFKSGWEICTQEEDRFVPFCVTIDDRSYQFALDFTPVEVLGIKDFDLVHDQFYEIKFTRDLYADKYRIYYTNYLPLKDSFWFGGEEVFANIPSTLGYFWDYVEFSNEDLEQGCDLSILGGHLCGDEINYLLDLGNDGPLIFTITNFKDNQEANILKFEQI